MRNMASVPRWNKDTTLKFVKEYRSRECLWNTKSVIYKNRNARETALQELQEVMAIEGFGVAEVKNKIKALRSTYSQELKKIKESKKSGAGTDSVYKPRVNWFEEMHTFLHYLDNKRPKQVNLQPSTSTTNTISDLSDQEFSLVDAGNESSESQSARMQSNRDESQTQKTANFETLKPMKRRKTNMENISKALKDLKEISNDVTKELGMENEFVIFGKSVAAQLIKLNARNALLAQERIQSILTQFRVSELQSASAKPLYRSSQLQ